MAYPVTGALATLTSVTASTDANQLLTTALRLTQVTINTSGAEDDVTELTGSVTAAQYLSGLSEGTMGFEGRYPKTTPRRGNVGLVTFASGYVLYAKGFNLNIDFGENDITQQSGAPTWRRFMPAGIIEWSGSYTCVADSATAAPVPTTTSSTGAAATFKLSEDGTNDPLLAGNIIVTGIRHGPIVPRQQQLIEVTFRGSGTLTETFGDSSPRLFAASGSGGATAAVNPPDWDTDGDGVPDVEFVYTYASGQTYTAKGFLRNVSLSVQVGDPVAVTGTVRFSDAVTPG